MKAEEFKAGLIALDIKQEHTLPYAAYQNGKQDSRNILAVVLAGDNRLPEKLRQTNLLPLESRIRIRHHLDKRPQAELIQILSEVIKQAGAPELMTSILIQALAEHSMGNLRAMMFMANDLLATAAETGQRQLDENLFFDVYRGIAKKKRTGK